MLPASSLSTETCRAVQELWRWSCEGLDDHQRQELKKLLDDNVDLYAADEDCTRTRLVQHYINTGSSPPICLRPHWLTLAKRWVAEVKIREMPTPGVIEPSDSPWAAPAVLVRKKDDSWRFCMDYR